MKKVLFALVLFSNMLYGQQHVFQGKLGNGLRMIVVPKKSHPKVLVQLWYGVGSKDEIDGRTGLSHILEHMMFTGTESVKGFSEEIGNMSGDLNAITSRDYTYYYEYVPKQFLPRCLELEADRMHNLKLTPQGIKNELLAVTEERLMRMSLPSIMLYEQAMAALFIRGAYHHFPIGWMSDIKNTKVQDISNWYHNWYAPNNAILVVAGPVDPNEVYKLANKYFGAIKPTRMPERSNRPDVELTANTVLKLQSKSFSNDSIGLDYIVPSIKSNKKDSYALVLLASLLADGKRSLLYRDMVDAGLTTGVGVSYSPLSMYNFSFSFILDISSGTAYQQALQKLKFIVEQIASGTIQEQDVKRAKAMVLATNVFAQDDFSGLVTQVGNYAILGLDPEQRLELAKNIQAVTKQDLQRVAKKYLQDSKYVMRIMLKG